MATPISTGMTGKRYGSRFEEVTQGVVQDVISRSSNLGSDNPFKGPTARSLFYEAAQREPGKYGQFLFYSLGNNDTNFIDAYYRSESSDYNRNISSLKSKNPSAGFLIRETVALESLNGASSIQNLPGLTSNFERSIIGGRSAPYHWKDFLYCKYYGTIPNNYMITLRRFPTPVLDNLSVPEGVKNSELYAKNGAGRPVAQAVTWFGGNTGNNISTLLSFTTGMNWGSRDQQEVLTQEQNSKGFTNDKPYKWLQSVLGLFGQRGADALGVGGDILEKLTVAADPLNETVDNMRTYGIRDLAKDGTGRAGVMSEYIWVPVDTIANASYRARGLSFEWNSLSLTFDYELSSVGEVNTKAALIDILGNLLAIGTNYGNFMTPNFRYSSEFPALGFPGGDAGYEEFYKNPLAWLIKYGHDIVNATASATDPTQGQGVITQQVGGTENQGDFKNLFNELGEMIKAGSPTDAQLNTLADKYHVDLAKVLKLAVTQDFLAGWQLPASFLTGAPIGEWHVVIGNPCNPIAMIGNLICTGVSISFNEQLGPDDFPTGIKAVFSLKHARDRDRGDLESVFNRGDGRLYQSSAETSSNSQSFSAFADTTGQVFSQERADQILQMQSFFGSVTDMNSPDQTGLDANGLPNFIP